MKIVKRNKKREGDNMAHRINLDDLKKDLDDLAVDLLTPPEKLDVVTLLEDRLETHKKLRSIINNRLNFKFIN